MGSYADASGGQEQQLSLAIVASLDTVAPWDLPELFDAIAKDPSDAIRAAGAARVSLCPPAFPRFLLDESPTVQIAAIRHSRAVRDADRDSPMVLGRLTDAAWAGAVRAPVRRALVAALPEHIGDDQSFAAAYAVLRLYMDDACDEVRMDVAGAVRALAARPRPFLLPRMSAVFRLMLVDVQWRVRQVGVELLYAAALAADARCFAAAIFPHLLAFLRDPCLKVRQFALTGLPALVARFPALWATGQLFAELRPLAFSPSYLQRELFLGAVVVLARAFPPPELTDYAHMVLHLLFKDPVESVVFTAMLTLLEHLPIVPLARLEKEVIPFLQGLRANGSPTLRLPAEELLKAVGVPLTTAADGSAKGG
jgi:hypothetical protein